jgi:hypothetical protein
MLALDDAALARLAIGATRIRASERGRWLQNVARKLDPPKRPLTRQGRWRQRQRNGGAIYRLTGRLTKVEAFDHVRAGASRSRPNFVGRYQGELLRDRPRGTFQTNPSSSNRWRRSADTASLFARCTLTH